MKNISSEKITRGRKMGLSFLGMAFLATLISTRTWADDTIADKADRAIVDTKKSGRSVKSDLKKTGRKVTGQESAVEDLKDSAKDTWADGKDEARYAKRKLKKKPSAP